MSKDFEKKLEEFVDFIEKASVEEVKQFISAIEETFDISTQTVSQFVGVDKKEEPVITNYNVKLVNVGINKIPVLKVIRDVLQLSLLDSKKKIDSVPFIIMENATDEVAQEIKKKFEEQGATIELIGV